MPPDLVGEKPGYYGYYSYLAPFYHTDSYDLYSAGADQMMHLCTGGYNCNTITNGAAWISPSSGARGDDINNWNW